MLGRVAGLWAVWSTPPGGQQRGQQGNSKRVAKRTAQAAAAEGHLDRGTLRALVLPKRRGGRRWEFSERRFLTRAQLGRLLAEIPSAHAPLFVLLAFTGLRISEAIALRWCDLDLDASPPRLRVRRAIVKNVVGAPKSRYGARTVLLANELAGELRALRPSAAQDEDEPSWISRRR